jgi:hypothetical protein
MVISLDPLARGLSEAGPQTAKDDASKTTAMLIPEAKLANFYAYGANSQLDEAVFASKFYLLPDKRTEK